MQIKCSKCGFENQMGVIFCRQCGEKINMDEISPESLEEGKSKENAGKTAGKIIRWTVRILLLLIVLGLLAAVLAPWGLPVYTAPDETTDEFKKKEEQAKFKLELYSAEKAPRFLKPVSFSMEELNILFSKHFLKEGENKTTAWTLEHVVLSKENDRIRMLVFAKMFDHIPVLFRADGMVSAGGSAETPLAIQVDSAAIGHLPLFYCNSFVSSKLVKILSGNDEIKRIFERAGSVSLKEESLVFDFRQPEKSTASEVETAEPPKVKAASPSDTESAPAPAKKGKKKSGKKKSKKSRD